MFALECLPPGLASKERGSDAALFSLPALADSDGNPQLTFG
jgi:hypothetical protein